MHAIRRRGASPHLFLLEGKRLAVGVGFNTARVMRSGAVQNLHQILQGVLQTNI